MSRWWRDNKEGAIAFLIVVAIVVAVYAVVFWLQGPVACNARTADMGFEHRWSLFGGCQIEVVESQWIPLESYYWKQEGE